MTDLYVLEIKKKNDIFYFIQLLRICILIFDGSYISSLADNNCLCSFYIRDSLLLFAKVKFIRLSKACLHTFVVFVNNLSVLLLASEDTSA